jgi:hypothetical protein
MLPAGNPALYSLRSLPGTFQEDCPAASKLDEHVVQRSVLDGMRIGRDAYRWDTKPNVARVV